MPPPAAASLPSAAATAGAPAPSTPLRRRNSSTTAPPRRPGSPPHAGAPSHPAAATPHGLLAPTPPYRPPHTPHADAARPPHTDAARHPRVCPARPLPTGRLTPPCPPPPRHHRLLLISIAFVCGGVGSWFVSTRAAAEGGDDRGYRRVQARVAAHATSGAVAAVVGGAHARHLAACEDQRPPRFPDRHPRTGEEAGVAGGADKAGGGNHVGDHGGAQQQPRAHLRVLRLQGAERCRRHVQSARLRRSWQPSRSNSSR